MKAEDRPAGIHFDSDGDSRHGAFGQSHRPGVLRTPVSRSTRRCPFEPASSRHRRTRAGQLCPFALWNARLADIGTHGRIAFRHPRRIDWRNSRFFRRLVQKLCHGGNRSFPLAAMAIPAHHRPRAFAAERFSFCIRSAHVRPVRMPGLGGSRASDLCRSPRTQQLRIHSYGPLHRKQRDQVMPGQGQSRPVARDLPRRL